MLAQFISQYKSSTRLACSKCASAHPLCRHCRVGWREVFFWTHERPPGNARSVGGCPPAGNSLTSRPNRKNAALRLGPQLQAVLHFWILLVSGNATDVTMFGAPVLCTSGSNPRCAEVIRSISMISGTVVARSGSNLPQLRVCLLNLFILFRNNGRSGFALFAGVSLIMALERSLGVVMDPNRQPHEEIVEVVQLVTQHKNSLFLSDACSGKRHMLPQRSACRCYLPCGPSWCVAHCCGFCRARLQATPLSLDIATAHSVWRPGSFSCVASRECPIWKGLSYFR